MIFVTLVINSRQGRQRLFYIDRTTAIK